jgi:fructosamine-3-kinase
MEGGKQGEIRVWQAIEQGISEATGTPFRVDASRAVGGGCINEAQVVEGAGQRFFIKLNDASRLAMFEAEAAGLEAIRASGSIRAPRPVAAGLSGQHSWLALEYIEFGSGDGHTSERLGRQLAAMHRCEASQFGWQRDNTIGATPQPNAWHSDWVAFLRDQRLGFQLALAGDNGAPARLLDSGLRLLGQLGAFFTTYRPAPSLLHGDLWGGNWGADSSGAPVIFDPAVYFGDREADIAMTALFGGFDRQFYGAYEAEWPLDVGYGCRETLYNLYHILNHYNLFGGGYAARAEEMIERLLAELSG